MKRTPCISLVSIVLLLAVGLPSGCDLSTPTPEVLDLNVIVTEMANMLRRLVSENIEIVLALSPELRPVKSDPGQGTTFNIYLPRKGPNFGLHLPPSALCAIDIRVMFWTSTLILAAARQSFCQKHYLSPLKKAQIEPQSTPRTQRFSRCFRKYSAISASSAVTLSRHSFFQRSLT